MANTLPRLSDSLKVTEHQGMDLGLEPSSPIANSGHLKAAVITSPACLPTLYYLSLLTKKI